MLKLHSSPKLGGGEFVELERLLFKIRDFKRFNREDQRLEMVNRQGRTYFTPAEDNNKITGIRKWEQAFRVYATIYSEANPVRSWPKYFNTLPPSQKQLEFTPGTVWLIMTSRFAR